MSRLQQWQFDVNSLGETMSEHLYLPFDNTLRNIMIGYIRKCEKTDDDTLIQAWSSYWSCVYDNINEWRNIPDPTLKIQATLRFNHLEAFYTEIATAYSIHSPDPYIAEIYREKLDQAMDLLTISNPLSYSTSSFPLVQLDADRHDVTIIEAATRIVDNRTVWLRKMTELESCRLRGTDEMLYGIGDIRAACTMYVNMVHDMYTT